MSSNGTNTERLDLIFAALAEPRRRQILKALAAGESSIEALAEPIGASGWSALKHVRVLENSGLIVTEKVGRKRVCRLRTETLDEVTAWTTDLRTFWSANLGRLEAHLSRDD